MVFQEGYKGIKGVLRMFKGCFKGDLRAFKGSLKDISKKFKGCFKEVSKKVLACVFQCVLINVSWVIHGCFKGI